MVVSMPLSVEPTRVESLIRSRLAYTWAFITSVKGFIEPALNVMEVVRADLIKTDSLQLIHKLVF
jgi:hypothetical protein